MRKILLLGLNDLRLTVRDRTVIIWMLLLPLALMWFFGGMFEPSGPVRITLTVVNHDDGWLSRAFIEELQVEQINLRPLTPEEAETAGDKVRTLIIPEGFTEKVVAGEQQELRLETDPDTSDTYALAAQVHLLKAIVRTTGRLIEINPDTQGTEPSDLIRSLIVLLADAVPDTGDDDRETGDLETRFRNLAERPRLVDLEVSMAGEGRPVPSGTAQSVPGILTMSVLMCTLIYGAVFLTMEKSDGTLKRQLTLPVHRAHVFAGKLLGRLLLTLAQIVVLLLAGQFLFGLAFEDCLPGLLLLILCYALSVTGLSTLLGAVLKTPEQAGSLGWLVAMGMAALGGCWWPSEVMPRWLWQVAHVFPTAWAMDGFHSLISFGRGLEGIWLPCLVLTGFGILFSALGIRFLKTAGI